MSTGQGSMQLYKTYSSITRCCEVGWHERGLAGTILPRDAWPIMHTTRGVIWRYVLDTKKQTCMEACRIDGWSHRTNE